MHNSIFSFKILTLFSFPSLKGKVNSSCLLVMILCQCWLSVLTYCRFVSFWLRQFIFLITYSTLTYLRFWLIGFYLVIILTSKYGYIYLVDVSRLYTVIYETMSSNYPTRSHKWLLSLFGWLKSLEIYKIEMKSIMYIYCRTIDRTTGKSITKCSIIDLKYAIKYDKVILGGSSRCKSTMYTRGIISGQTSTIIFIL